MFHKTTAKRRLLFYTLGLTYIAVGILGTLPGASLLQLARNTHVSLAVAGGMFTVSAFGSLLGAMLAGALTRRVHPKYLMTLGLLLLTTGSLTTALTNSFPVLLVGQGATGLGFGFIDIGLNTITTLAFQDALSENLNNIHGMFGLGALLGPLILAFGLQFFNGLQMAYFVGAFVATFTIVLALLQRVPALPRKSVYERQKNRTRSTEERRVLRQGLLWLLILQISLYAAAEIGFGSWIVTAVSKSAGITLALAAPVATAFYMGLTAGRLAGAQLLKRSWLNEERLLYLALGGGALSGVLVALFPGQLFIAYTASALVGCFYGPLFPSIMAIISRRFVHALGLASSLTMIGTGAGAMILPALMGALIPVLGINWVMAIPALLCLLVIPPMLLAHHMQPGLSDAEKGGEKEELSRSG